MIEGAQDDVQPITRFQDSPFRKAIRKELLAAGYTEPTPIQAYGWPLLLSGRDCIAIAKTGSGKTLAFLLPALHNIYQWLQEEGPGADGAGPLALVVAPTRELAAQIHREAERFARGCRAGCVHGGTAWEPQAALLEAGLELLVATPGRLAFLMARGGEAAATAARAIASCGARKQLSEALAIFDRFVAENGSPTRHLFSSFLNVHVLCGDLRGAVQVAAKMQENDLPLGVVEYTTLLKGHLNAGDVDASKAVLETMSQASPPIYPDIRAANTFLRGCLKLGALPDAEEFYAQLPKWAIEPDAATVKIWGQILAQGLRLKPLQQLWKETESKESSLEQLDNAAGLNCAIAQVACLLGARKAAGKALERAGNALATELTAQAEFDRLRRQELQREVASLKKAIKAAPFDLVAFFRRLLAAPSQRQGRNSASGAVTPFEALRRGFGLPQCFERGLCSEEDFQTQLARCLRGGRLRWNRLFGAKRPTLLEVCSGTGDWVVAQAQADAGRANWVASELRYDRAWSIMTKAVFASVDNLAVIAGDAGTVLKEWVLPGSVAKVCVNFPEPPQTTRNANCDEAESELHLLTSDFFEDVHKALSDGGVLTIFSDNQEYMRSLARTLGLLRRPGRPGPDGRLFEASSDVDASHLEDAEEMCGLLICRGCPGEAEGHAAKVSSQFDRFFQHGQHTDRFYISVVKVQVTSQDDQL
ncbi:RH20 [Symbiodinium necroappetens]|uniref:tRNA (guanine(46)-N(7))-methyltransferase n=1 Tax=Symbiodinium necroappetens TaxID=1628268 RepID=A0A813C6C0_9DINO|nr:RH20 [Symbiodinium necroappetens]